MPLSIEKYDLIMKFTDGFMTIEEMELLDKNLRDDPQMREQLDFELAIRDHPGMRKLAIKTDAVFPTKNGKSRFGIMIAASVAVLMILAALLQQPQSSLKPITAIAGERPHEPGGSLLQQTIARDQDNSVREIYDSLFKQYFKRDDLPGEYPMYLADAFTGYEEKNYTKLQGLDLSSVPETRGINDGYSSQDVKALGHYYKGISFLVTGNAGKAISELQWVINYSPAYGLKAKALWFTALGYLKNKNMRKAPMFFTLVANDRKNVYNDKAHDVLKFLTPQE